MLHPSGDIRRQQNIYGILKSLHMQPLIMKGIGLLYIKTTQVNLNTIRILKRNQIKYWLHIFIKKNILLKTIHIVQKSLIMDGLLLAVNRILVLYSEN